MAVKWVFEERNKRIHSNNTELALETNNIKAKIQKNSDNSKYQLCKTKDETNDHMASVCIKTVQCNYKECHVRVAAMLQKDLF